MNFLYDSDSSDASDGSSVWSDSGDEPSEEQLARGFFSQPNVYVEEPRNDMFLRKNETRLIEYPLHQQRLFPLLAQAFSLRNTQLFLLD